MNYKENLAILDHCHYSNRNNHKYDREYLLLRLLPVQIFHVCTLGGIRFPESDLILNPWEIHSTWQYKNPFQQDCDLHLPLKGPYWYLLQVPLNAAWNIRVQKSKIQLWLLKKVHSILIESMTLNPTKRPDIFGIEDSKQIPINDFRFSGFDWLLEGL